MEKKEIVEILEYMKKIYQGRTIDDSESAIDTWMIMFEGYKKDEVIGALRTLVKKNRYVPSIHEIINAVDDSFSLEKMQRKDFIIIRVRYRDEIIPFRFTDPASANEFVQILKQRPSRDDLRLLYERNVDDNFEYRSALKITPSKDDRFSSSRNSKNYYNKWRFNQ